MPSKRDFSLDIVLPKASAEHAFAALNLIQQHEEHGKDPDPPTLGQPEPNAPFEAVFPWAAGNLSPEVQELALTLFRELSEHDQPRKKRPLFGLDVGLVPLPKKKGLAQINIYTEFEVWVEHNTPITIVQVCQKDLGAEPTGWMYHDDIYGERSEGAVFIAPGQEPQHITLETWLEHCSQEHQENASRSDLAPNQPVVLAAGEMHVLIPMAEADRDTVRLALATIDQQGTDWLTAFNDPDSLDFAKAFPHMDMLDPPDGSVQRLALKMLKSLALTNPDSSTFNDIAEGFATAPSAYVTTQIGTTDKGDGALHVLSVEQDDVDNLPQAIRACQAVTETVKKHFSPTPAPQAQATPESPSPA